MNSSDAKDNEARRQLGLRLQAARKQRGLSQAELATRGGLSQSQISKLERGERDLIYRDACTLAVSLGLPLQWLIDGRLRPHPQRRFLATELVGYGLSDLRVPQHPEAEVLGAFRALEEIIPLALTGSSEPRIVEALPVLPILHPLDARLLFAFARRAGVLRRVGLILDISLFLLRRGSWISPSLVQGDEDEIERFLTLAFEAIKEEPSRSDPHADHPILKRWHAELGINIEDYEVRARQLLEGRINT